MSIKSPYTKHFTNAEGRREAIGVPHGTATSYGYHDCRCMPCTLANRKVGRESMAKAHRKDPSAYNARVRAAREKKKAILEAEPDHPDHGKNGSYTAGCRCPLCTEARKLYSRAERAKLKQKKEAGK